MLLSFVIPHYNLQRELLQRCIDSIATLSMPASDYEIVIVDDGSDTPPQWVSQAFPQTSIKVIEAGHGGPGAARNRGIEEAEGEYIQFIDADDSIIPEVFSHCTELLKNQRPDILQHGYRVCNSSEQMLQKTAIRRKYRTYATGAEYVSHNNLSGSPCVYIFKRELTTKFNIRFAENVMHEDEDFNIKIYHYGNKLILCNNIAYNYYQRENSITVNRDSLHEIQRISDLFKLLQRVVDFRFAQQEVCTLQQRAALNRKLAMLTVDTLINLFYNGECAGLISHTCRTELRPLGLYPLPTAHYSLKYTVFRILANSNIGIKILRRMLPMQKPQKR